MDPRIYSNRRRASTLNKDSYDRVIEKQLNENKEFKNKQKEAINEAYSDFALQSKRKINKQKLNEAIREHQENCSLYGLTEAIFLVAKNALLLDESYIASVNPSYENDMKEVIRNFLESENISKEFNDKDVNSLCEAIARNIPAYKEGILVEAADIEYKLANEINNTKELNSAISNLSGDVASRVASMVDKNQSNYMNMYEEVQEAKSAKKKYDKKVSEVANPDVSADGTLVDELIAGVQSGEIKPEDLPALLQTGEIDEATYDAVVSALGLGEEQPEVEPEQTEEAPMEDPDAPVEEAPAEEQQMVTGKAIHIEPDGTTSILMQNGQLSLNRDGSVDIQLAEAADSALMKQSQMANGWSMSKQGSYDPEMLLAKGLGAVKSTLGLDIATMLLAASVVGLPAAYGTGIAKSIRHEKNLEKLNSEQYKELRDYAKNDPKVISILKKIKYELGEDKPERKTLKALNQELKVELKRVKAEHRETLKEQIESLREFDYVEGYEINIQEAMDEIASKEFHNLTESEMKICAAAHTALYASLLEAAGTLEDAEDKLNDEPVDKKVAMCGWLFAGKAGSILLYNLKHKVDENFDEELAKAVEKCDKTKAIIEDIKKELNKEEMNIEKIEELHKKFVEKCSEIEAKANEPKKEHKNDDVIENLAVNEGYKQLREGKEFDANAAIANAIVYVTVLETLDRTGIVEIGKEGYNRLLEACAKNRKKDQVKTRSRKFNNETDIRLEEEGRRNVIKDILSNSINESFMSQTFRSTRTNKEYQPKESKETMLNRIAESHYTSNSNINENFYMMNGRKYSENEMNNFLYSQGFHNGLREDFDVLKNYFGIKKL